MRGENTTKYKHVYAKQAYKLCLLGATDEDLAQFFEVCRATISNWKNDHPSFAKALKKGKDIADAEVADSLHKRAIGYSHDDVHISSYQGVITTTKIKKHYPPDTEAGKFWLKNRQKENFRDKQDHELTGKDGNPLMPETIKIVYD